MSGDPRGSHGIRAMLKGWEALFILAGALPTVARAQTHTQTQEPATIPLVFDGVTVIDVEQGKLLSDQRVVITGNRIREVGSASAISIPSSAKVVQAKGKYLIPGLWDMHMHPGLLGAGLPVPEGVNITTDITYLLFIANGVTGIRDAWSQVPLDTMVRWRREILADTRVGPPRQLLSGVAFDEDAACVRKENDLTGHVCIKTGDSADVNKLVRELKAHGADWLKTYNLNEQDYFLVAHAARQYSLRFGGHSQNVNPFDAADSGATSLDHVGSEHVGILDSLCYAPATATVEGCRKVAEKFKQTNTWGMPTMSNRSIRWFKNSSTEVIPKRLGKTVADFWKNFTYNPTWLHGHEVLPLPANPDTLQFGYLKIPMEVGLPLLSGGDTGGEDAGFKTQDDMAIMVDRGLTPLASLQAATLNPAKAIRGTDSLGTVAAGKLADLVLLDGNPLADITNTTMISGVVANGHYFDRAALDGLLAEIKTRAKAGH